MPIRVKVNQTPDKIYTKVAQSGVPGQPGPIGLTGATAYELAVTEGFVGTLQDYLVSLVGPTGESAYELAVSEGFVGTLGEWLESLQGPQGIQGIQGIPGQDGTDGSQGIPGQDGATGTDGESAYELAVSEGFVGTLQEYLVSLVGPQGIQGIQGIPGQDGGIGQTGPQGDDGLSAYEIAVAEGFVGTIEEWLASLVGPEGQGASNWNDLAGTVDTVPFDTTPLTDVVAVGELKWSEAERGLVYGVEGGDISVGKETWDIFTDLDGGLADGDTVSIVTVSGNRRAVRKTNSTNETLSKASIGMVTHVNADLTVRVTLLGEVHKLNTLGLIEGSLVYVDPANPGKWTQTIPASPNFVVEIGIVVVAHQTNGIISVRPQLVGVSTNDPRLVDSRTPLAHNQALSTITGAGTFAPLNYTESDTAPLNPNPGDEWLDTTTLIKYKRYDNFWVDVSGSSVTSASIASALSSGDYTLNGNLTLNGPVGFNATVYSFGSGAAVAFFNAAVAQATADVLQTSLGGGAVGRLVFSAATVTSAKDALEILDPLSTTRRTQPIVMESDFMVPDVNATWPGFIGGAIGAGVISNGSQSSTANHPGTISLLDSTTANGGYRVQTSTVALLLTGGEIFEMILRVSSARATQTIRLGFGDTTTSTAFADGAWIEIVGNGTAAVISGKTASNTTSSTTGTSYTLALNTWVAMKVELNAAGTLVTFSVTDENGTLLWSNTLATNIPTGAGRQTGAGIIATESTTDAGVTMCEIDYGRLIINRTFVR